MANYVCMYVPYYASEIIQFLNLYFVLFILTLINTVYTDTVFRRYVCANV